jgi:hypothetical protein
VMEDDSVVYIKHSSRWLNKVLIINKMAPNYADDVEK